MLVAPSTVFLAPIDTHAPPRPSTSLTLVNRLVLNLRRAGNIDINSVTVPSLATPAFAETGHSVLGNIGAPLRSGSENYDLEDDDDDQLEIVYPNEVQLERGKE